MQRKTKFCLQVHYVMESICINKHMFAQRNLQLTRIELWIPSCFFTKNSQKNGRKFRENLNMVLIVGDDVEWHFHSPGMTSRYGNLAKNTQKINKKNTNAVENVMYWYPWLLLFKSIHQSPCWPNIIPSIPFKAHIHWENGCGIYRNIAGTIFHF